jgi:hypothetical protein
MSSLSAKPGYNEALAQKDALKAQVDALFAQRDAAAREFGIESQQAQQYQQQASALAPQYIDAVNRVQEIITSPSPDLASPTVTTGQNQSTPAANARDNALATTTQDGGTGAGTSSNSSKSINSDNNAKPTSSRTRGAVNTSVANLNQFIPTQPNQLDQYASYTYGLSWYLMSIEQYNQMMDTQKPIVEGWKLLMQSGGAPAKGRSQAFSLDYYMDDLEITTLVPTGGVRFAHSATDMRFKVTEPNGITLIQSIFEAVQGVYKNSKQNQTKTQQPDLVGESYAVPGTVASDNSNTVNYLTAHYCMVIRFYGYDKDGNLIAPAKGAFNTDAASGGYGQTSVITKYFPFTVTDIKFQIANRAIEYNVTGKCTGQFYAFHTDRGTVPTSFTMTGQTVEQLLNGPQARSASAATSGPDGRKDTPAPGQTINDISASAGVDINGNFTGETQSPFQGGA